MGKRDKNDKKSVKRLQLRREVIRVLASDSLARVHGGALGCGPTGGNSLCNPSTFEP